VRVSGIVILMSIVQTLMAQVSPHGPLKIPCQSCHETESWDMRKDGTFKHESVGFALSGKHKAVKCESCHEGLKFSKMSSSCTSCHTDVHRSELGADCLKCHSTKAWSVPDMMQKHLQTHFPLVGRHQSVQCQSCHINASQQQYVGTPTTCIGCHRIDYETSKNPDHRTAGFTIECAQCHQVTSLSWGGSFDHSLTRFPLTGAHRSAQCGSCHQNNMFTALPTECVSCHRSDYQQAMNPNHVSANFPTTCQTCHTTTQWSGAVFNHSATRFPLTGAHITTTCQSCHTNGNYQLVYNDCYQCHATDFGNTTNPNHATGNFGHDCTQCHSTTGWIPATFNHSATLFPLTGAHTTAACQSCHASGNYQLHYTNCYQCHATNFAGTTNPNHVAGNFSHDCTQCHSTTNWSSSTFNHSTTLFPLTGAHVAVQCQSCHVSGNYQLHYTDCYQCHATDFTGTTNPNHVTGNFSHDCTQCHSTTGWTPATFNHSTTLFPLTGAHTTTSCQSCHVNGNYQLHYTDCYQCHQSDFQGVANPNHVTQVFNHACSPCHSTSVWTPNTMNHDANWFRIYSGRHRNNWTQCSQCHTVPGNLTSFSCTAACHQNAHNQGQNCYSCHRNA
jgi:hypothetical protein